MKRPPTLWVSDVCLLARPNTDPIVDAMQDASVGVADAKNIGQINRKSSPSIPTNDEIGNKQGNTSTTKFKSRFDFNLGSYASFASNTVHYVRVTVPRIARLLLVT